MYKEYMQSLQRKRMEKKQKTTKRTKPHRLVVCGFSLSPSEHINLILL